MEEGGLDGPLNQSSQRGSSISDHDWRKFMEGMLGEKWNFSELDVSNWHVIALRFGVLFALYFHFQVITKYIFLYYVSRLFQGIYTHEWNPN